MLREKTWPVWRAVDVMEERRHVFSQSWSCVGSVGRKEGRIYVSNR